MKYIYIRNLYLEILKQKKRLTVFVIFFILLMGAAGLKKYMDLPDGYTEEEQLKITEYEENIKEFDNAIEELTASLRLAERQVQITEEYCENSIYMQLDPQKIYVSSVQYGIQTTSSVGNILSACTAYINDGSMKEDISEKLDDIPAEYLKEIITCSSSNNVLTISVMHYDEQSAEKIMDKITEQMENQATEIAGIEGEFILEELDETSYIKADVSVVNTQNTNLNNYKNNQNNLANLRKSLIDQRNNRRSYIEYNKPEEPEVNKSFSIIFKYLIFGIILGIGVPFSVVCLKYIISDRIKSAKELSASGIAVLGLYKSVDELKNKAERDVMDIQLLADEKKSKMVCLNILGEDPTLVQSTEMFAEQLQSKGIQTYKISSVQQNMDELKKMIEVKNCIMMAEVGNTTYTQLEEMMQLCCKFNIDIWGCVVIE